MEKQCALLVVGAGGSGLVAAARAAEISRKKVIVLEKGKKTGGGMQMATAMRTFGSQWQKDRGLPDVTVSYLRKVMDDTYWRLDPELAYNAICATGSFFDWFCENTPKETIDLFTEGMYIFDDESGPIGPQLGGPGQSVGSGRLFMETALRKCNELGVEVLTETSAVSSVVEDGKIKSITAVGPDGEISIACDMCILACGSWINNKEVTGKYYPEFVSAQQHMRTSPHTNPHYTGDGFKLIEGLDLESDDKNFTLRLMGPHLMIHDAFINSMSKSAYSITVNKNAKRYVCEPSELRLGVFNSGLIQMEQPEGQVYIIFDLNNVEAAIADAAESPPPQIKGMPFGPLQFPATTEIAMNDFWVFINEKAPKNVVVADTITELAEKLGINGDDLNEQISRYNSYCEEGIDRECFKDVKFLVPISRAPYIGLKADLGTDGAFGGVLVNGNMNAIRKDGSIVENLFVTGDFASGRFINMAGVKVQLINDMSWALASGFIAGTNSGNALKD